MQDPADEFAGVAERIADHAQALNVRVAVAESLSSGGIANSLGAAPEASAWFTGGVVVYAESVKRGVLGVTAEVITSAQCARELATGVAKLLGAEAAVAVTGVGGPQSVDGLPPGTVFIAVACPGRSTIGGTTSREIRPRSCTRRLATRSSSWSVSCARRGELARSSPFPDSAPGSTMIGGPRTRSQRSRVVRPAGGATCHATSAR